MKQNKRGALISQSALFQNLIIRGYLPFFPPFFISSFLAFFFIWYLLATGWQGGGAAAHNPLLVVYEAPRRESRKIPTAAISIRRDRRHLAISVK